MKPQAKDSETYLKILGNMQYVYYLKQLEALQLPVSVEKRDLK